MKWGKVVGKQCVEFEELQLKSNKGGLLITLVILIQCCWLWVSVEQCVWNPAVFSVSLGVWEIDASLCSIRVSGEMCTPTPAIDLVLKIDCCLHPCHAPDFNLPVMLSFRPPREMLWIKKEKQILIYMPLMLLAKKLSSPCTLVGLYDVKHWDATLYGKRVHSGFSDGVLVF